PKPRIVQRVDDVVVLADLSAESAVGADERIEGIAQHFASAAGHYLDLGYANVDLWFLGDPDRRFRDIDGVVAHALEVIRDFDGADDEAEITGHRLLQREQLHGSLF